MGAEMMQMGFVTKIPEGLSRADGARWCQDHWGWVWALACWTVSSPGLEGLQPEALS